MSRLIDADKIDFNEVFVGASDFSRDTREAAQSLIDAQPTIEAVPVVHGEWIVVDEILGIKIMKCSACGVQHATLPRHYCDNCGAKMKEGAE